jgi:beta-glucanase (GH16 family)
MLLWLAIAQATIPVYPGYRLDWYDEFNRNGPPSLENWIYETGFVRNEEAQFYTPKNVVCQDGYLVIEARRESVPNQAYDPNAPASDWRKSRKEANYSSGSIKTMGKRKWTYGRFEMKGRIDIRAGLWPAFWTVGQAREWPRNGEIDIMEYFNRTLLANVAWGTEKQWVASWDAVRKPIADVARDAGFASPEEWAKVDHIWRMDWDADFIRLYVDGTLMNETDLSKTINKSPDRANPFHEPQHIILNLAIGGTSGGNPSKTDFPARFLVDWVRVYQKWNTETTQKANG